MSVGNCFLEHNMIIFWHIVKKNIYCKCTSIHLQFLPLILYTMLIQYCRLVVIKKYINSYRVWIASSLQYFVPDIEYCYKNANTQENKMKTRWLLKEYITKQWQWTILFVYREFLFGCFCEVLPSFGCGQHIIGMDVIILMCTKQILMKRS